MKESYNTLISNIDHEIKVIVEKENENFKTTGHLTATKQQALFVLLENKKHLIHEIGGASLQRQHNPGTHNPVAPAY